MYIDYILYAVGQRKEPSNRVEAGLLASGAENTLTRLSRQEQERNMNDVTATRTIRKLPDRNPAGPQPGVGDDTDQQDDDHQYALALARWEGEGGACAPEGRPRFDLPTNA